MSTLEPDATLVFTRFGKPLTHKKWTIIFEKSQNRFSFLVGPLQGKGGCLSFATEDDRNAFLEDPLKVSLVARFTETKSGLFRVRWLLRKR